VDFSKARNPFLAAMRTGVICGIAAMRLLAPGAA